MSGGAHAKQMKRRETEREGIVGSPIDGKRKGLLQPCKFGDSSNIHFRSDAPGMVRLKKRTRKSAGKVETEKNGQPAQSKLVKQKEGLNDDTVAGEGRDVLEY